MPTPIKDSILPSLDKLGLPTSVSIEGDDTGSISKWIQLIPIAGQVGDAASTIIAINSGKGKEGNPIVAKVVGNVPLFIAAKLGVGLGFALAGNYLAANGHKKVGKVLDIFGGVLGAGAALHNLRIK